ncbi:MAG TPA: GH1 family beta-glucosidase [Microlunatus sp.]|nr:GH1 family beta-glucosidase [Microlunatus sp.]
MSRDRTFSRRQALGLALGAAVCASCGVRSKPEVAGSSSPLPGAGQSPSPATPGADPAGRVTLPEGMLLGLSTSAYQVEGSVDADGRKPSIWDTFCRRPGAIDDGSSGAIACDHYRRWESDLDLISSLELTSYRFSIAWSRVLPDGSGTPNVKGLDFYRRLVDGLHARGISPMATLYHWDLPQALQDRGGWGERDSAGWFADYASLVFDRLDGVERWLTLNEPRVVVQNGYQHGVHAPGVSDDHTAGRVLHHLLLAHGRAVEAFRASGRPGVIGPCHVMTPCYPADGSAEAARATADEDLRLNRVYLDPLLRATYPADLVRIEAGLRRGIESALRNGDLPVIGTRSDFIGLNYYTPAVLDARGERQGYFPLTPIGWPIHPGGLYDSLIRLHRDYGMRVAVTETGLAGPADGPIDDQYRIDFFTSHLLAAQRAALDGVSIESFHGWSLLDNFEWAHGFTQRWGLVHVDFASQRRTPKPSARWLADVAAHHSVPPR